MAVPPGVGPDRVVVLPDDDVDRLVWQNPVEFFGQSGRLELDEVAYDRGETFAGSSVLRGERVES